MGSAGGSPGAKPPTRMGVLRKILLVDRDEYWGPAMRLALEETGYYLNWVKDPGEGRRRVLERVYDLALLSDSVGQPAVASLLEAVARLAKPPAALVLAGERERKGRDPWPAVPCLSILRRPCRVEEVVDAVRTLVGSPWSDRRRGA
jgi:DNA-binding response OmpR family regulator